MRTSIGDGETIVTNDSSRMFSFKNAIIITFALSAIQATVYALNLWLGSSGLILGTLIASLFFFFLAIAAIVVQAEPDTVQATTLMIALMIGLAAHALAKSINAFIPAQIIHMTVLIIMFWMQQH